ncbi:MAG: response regulator [Acidobacteria bacterium]|nr:response regulator [Acidobacteriota bacterium]
MIKILLIEDIEHYIEIQRGTLTRSNFEVLTAQNAPEAIRIARRGRPRLVILDLEMAERTGGDLLNLVRSEPALQSVPVLLISARQEAENVAQEYGFAAVLRKPVQPKVLLEVITKLLNLGRRVEIQVLVVASMPDGQKITKRIGRSVDVSETGMLAEFPSPLPEGSILDLRFFLPGQKEGITIRAEVARCASRTEDAYDTGLRFTDIEPADKERLQAFLAQAESEPARGALTAARLRLELRNTTAPEAASKRREDRKPVLKGARRA